MIRVIFVDDHASFRQPLAFMLDREPDITVVGQAGTITEARPLLHQANVAVVDLDLPDGNGVQLLSELRDVNPHASSLILTGSVERSEMARAVELGAAGVLHKSVRASEVIDAVRRAARGEHLFTQQEIEELLRLAAQRREEDRAADFALRQLTAREMEVLQSLSEGLSDKLIAQRLHVSTETVRSHMVRILSKLDVNSRLQALVFAVRHGVIEIK